MESATVFNEVPPDQARKWEELGALRIHVVDLDGSVGGKPANLSSVQKIVESVQVPIQVGGGIRGADTIAMYLDIGVSTVILGTIAARDPETVAKLIEQFLGRVAVGIDARSGMVAVEGWTEATTLRAADLANQFGPVGPVSFIYTDIERDGMMKGPNIEATREFARGTSIPVILSGGISTLEDVKRGVSLEPDGVSGIIIGRALYEGAVDLKDALRVAGEAQHAR